jgi:hypothetical protein
LQLFSEIPYKFVRDNGDKLLGKIGLTYSLGFRDAGRSPEIEIHNDA